MVALSHTAQNRDALRFNISQHVQWEDQYKLWLFVVVFTARRIWNIPCWLILSQVWSLCSQDWQWDKVREDNLNAVKWINTAVHKWLDWQCSCRLFIVVIFMRRPGQNFLNESVFAFIDKKNVHMLLWSNASHVSLLLTPIPFVFLLLRFCFCLVLKSVTEKGENFLTVRENNILHAAFAHHGTDHFALCFLLRNGSFGASIWSFASSFR